MFIRDYLRNVWHTKLRNVTIYDIINSVLFTCLVATTRTCELTNKLFFNVYLSNSVLKPNSSFLVESIKYIIISAWIKKILHFLYSLSSFETVNRNLHIIFNTDNLISLG